MVEFNEYIQLKQSGHVEIIRKDGIFYIQVKQKHPITGAEAEPLKTKLKDPDILEVALAQMLDRIENAKKDVAGLKAMIADQKSILVREKKKEIIFMYPNLLHHKYMENTNYTEEEKIKKFCERTGASYTDSAKCLLQASGNEEIAFDIFNKKNISMEKSPHTEEEKKVIEQALLENKLKSIEDRATKRIAEILKEEGCYICPIQSFSKIQIEGGQISYDDPKAEVKIRHKDRLKSVEQKP